MTCTAFENYSSACGIFNAALEAVWDGSTWREEWRAGAQADISVASVTSVSVGLRARRFDLI